MMLLFASCAGAAAASDSCCSMTEETLTAMRGKHGECPLAYDSRYVLSVDKCAPCPEFTCRVDAYCYCTGNFLDGYVEKTSGYPWAMCEFSFGETWPASIGKEDVTWRSCQDEVTVTDFGTKSCCDLTEDELNAADGTSDLCPLAYDSRAVKTIAKCETCPPGK